MDITSAQPQVNLSLLRSNSLKFNHQSSFLIGGDTTEDWLLGAIFSKRFWCRPTESMFFSVVFAPSPFQPPRQFWALPVISLLLTNIVSPVRACLLFCQRGFVAPNWNDERGPLSFQPSVVPPQHRGVCFGCKCSGQSFLASRYLSLVRSLRRVSWKSESEKLVIWWLCQLHRLI